MLTKPRMNHSSEKHSLQHERSGERESAASASLCVRMVDEMVNRFSLFHVNASAKRHISDAICAGAGRIVGYVVYGTPQERATSSVGTVSSSAVNYGSSSAVTFGAANAVTSGTVTYGSAGAVSGGAFNFDAAKSPIRDYIRGASLAMNPLPIWPVTTFQMDDGAALFSDLVTVGNDLMEVYNTADKIHGAIVEQTGSREFGRTIDDGKRSERRSRDAR
jgi:hypothetical protein